MTMSTCNIVGLSFIYVEKSRVTPLGYGKLIAYIVYDLTNNRSLMVFGPQVFSSLPECCVINPFDSWLMLYFIRDGDVVYGKKTKKRNPKDRNQEILWMLKLISKNGIQLGYRIQMQFMYAVQSTYKTGNHPEMVGRYVTCDLELWPIKNSFCAFLARLKTYTDTKN